MADTCHVLGISDRSRVSDQTPTRLAFKSKPSLMSAKFFISLHFVSLTRAPLRWSFTEATTPGLAKLLVYDCSRSPLPDCSNYFQKTAMKVCVNYAVGLPLKGVSCLIQLFAKSLVL